MDRGAWWAVVPGITGVKHNLVTNLPKSQIITPFHQPPLKFSGPISFVKYKVLLSERGGVGYPRMEH